MAQTTTPKSADQELNTLKGVAAHELTPDENIRIAEDLVRTLEQQETAVKQAYTRGYRDCGKDLAYIAAEQREAGYWAREADRLAEWDVLQKQIHQLSSAWSMSFEDRRAAEIAAVKARPNDFPGIERDPQCIERCRASVESIASNRSQRAA